jgi:N-acetylmuramoyl-L-alanine amidase
MPAGARARSPSPTPSPSATAVPLIAIDPGHGGEDPGARHFDAAGQMDLNESAINLQIAERVGEKLQQAGLRVYYTRDGDYLPNNSEDLNGDGEITARDDLLYRIARINDAGATLLLSLHENAWDTADSEMQRVSGGTETYYCAKRTFSKDNERLANLVHRHILSALVGVGYQPLDWGVLPDEVLAEPGDERQHLMVLGPEDTVIVRASQMPGVLSEPLVITCDAEAALMQRPDVQDALAQAYVDAILAYLRGES